MNSEWLWAHGIPALELSCCRKPADHGRYPAESRGAKLFASVDDFKDFLRKTPSHCKNCWKQLKWRCRAPNLQSSQDSISYLIYMKPRNQLSFQERQGCYPRTDSTQPSWHRETHVHLYRRFRRSLGYLAASSPKDAPRAFSAGAGSSTASGTQWKL